MSNTADVNRAVPNYPPVKEKDHFTVVTHRYIDGHSLWPVPHVTEQVARNYAVEVTSRCRAEVTVFGPYARIIATYVEGLPLQ